MKLKYSYVWFALITLLSCKNTMEVPAPQFKVNPSALTVQAGKELIFSFAGNPGLISFYSGELTRQYGNKDGRVEDANALKMGFTTSVQLGTQANQLSVLSSANFNGDYSSLNSVQQATWTDITSRFALGTTATFLTSGIKDISDLRVTDKPLYIAFRYLIRPQLVNGAARTWMMQAFAFTAETASGPVTLADMNNGGFRIVGSNPSGGTVTGTRVTFAGNIYEAGNDPQSEIWAISKAINTDKADLGPDRPVAIKGNSDARISQFAYTYVKAGIYKATFIGANANIEGMKEVVQDVEITVTP